jgi:hypothetical protein
MKPAATPLSSVTEVDRRIRSIRYSWQVTGGLEPAAWVLTHPKVQYLGWVAPILVPAKVPAEEDLTGHPSLPSGAPVIVLGCHPSQPSYWVQRGPGWGPRERAGACLSTSTSQRHPSTSAGHRFWLLVCHPVHVDHAVVAGSGFRENAPRQPWLSRAVVLHPTLPAPPKV